ncbi:MAG: SDR family NAD(P)-dependent oxidoreductase, partial [Betaproteobacteria bacterium]
MEIKGKAFLVTGAASGLGAGTARMIVANGGKIMVADLNEAAGNALATELGQAARFARTDVADEASGRAAVDVTVKAFGAIHGLINCAGIAIGERVVGKEGPHSLASFVR